MKFPDDINDLFELAKNNPEKLDEILKFESDKIINNARESNKSNLRQLQLKMNVIRSKNGENHLKSAIDFSGLMWDSFFDMNDALQKFKSIQEDVKKNEKKPIFRVVK